MLIYLNVNNVCLIVSWALIRIPDIALVKTGSRSVLISECVLNYQEISGISTSSPEDNI